jgi:inorganic pyrophosphatase
MVGDCVGSSADVFESVAAEIIGAMILGSTLANEAKMDDYQAAKFVFFPLVVHAMDIFVSSIGIAFVGITRDAADSDPMKQLQKVRNKHKNEAILLVDLCRSSLKSTSPFF